MAGKTYLKTTFAISLLMVVLAFAGTAHAKIIIVDDDLPADFNNIQAAIESAGHGDVIIVNPGTYTGEGNRDIDFLGKAITVRSLNGPETCIINCEGTESDSHRGFYFHSGEGPDSVLSGLTITNGYAPKRQIGKYIRMLGGAIYCDYSSPVITNCIFRENISGWKGGAIMSSGSKPKIINCLFRNNVAQWGGGLHTSAVYGSSQGPIMTNCTFVDNFANNHIGGGGVYCDSTGKTTLTNCILWGNTFQGGGGFRAQVELYNPVFSYCCIEGSFGSAPLLAPDGYHLLAGSPCIDAGDPNYIAEPDEKDLDGKPRIIGGRIDMGAYEYQPRILYVDDDTTGKNDGSSWADAYNYLQDALSAAWRGDEIRVAQGIYTPNSNSTEPNGSGDRTATFQLINGVAIKGGYAGCGAPDPNARDIKSYETILSGDLAGDDGPNFANNGDNSYQVITALSVESTAVLDGLTITAGNANHPHYLSMKISGGGMYMLYSSPTIIDCIFTSNSAAYGGAGLYNYKGNPTLTNCAFLGNIATSHPHYGGSGYGAGMHNSTGSPILTKCTFSNNHARGRDPEDFGGIGGGLFCYVRTMNDIDKGPTLIDCIFTDNTAQNKAGGMYPGIGNTILINCIFTRNSAESGGAMASAPRMMVNCLFFANSAEYGGAMYLCEDKKNLIINCTFVANSATFIGGIVDCEDSIANLTNCILFNNTSSGVADEPAQLYMPYGTPILNYSCIQGWTGNLGGTGNIGDDPRFVAPGYWDAGGLWVEGDYHLLPDSPCIDAGDPDYIPEPNETDLDGNPRVMGGRIDMGAYESPLQAEARCVSRTINLASQGKWITCYIWFPEEYNVADIDPNTVLLDGQVKAESVLPDERQQVATARFSREEAQTILNAGDTELTITGQLNNGIFFYAKDTIKVIDKSGKK